MRDDPSSAGSREELRQALSREGAPAAAKAATIAAEAGLVDLAPELVAAFRRFLTGLPRSDPGCAAKTAIVEALLRLDHEDEEVLAVGIRHVQREPVLGGQVDTAPPLRAVCARGLARTSGPDVLVALAELLADPEAPARAAAAHAIGNHGAAAGVPLLRHKVRAGDEEPRVTTECLVSLLHLDPEGSLPFVSALLEEAPLPGRGGRDLSECAADALGESHLEGAFPVLRDWLPRARACGLGPVALRALATLRRDEAFDFLLELVRNAEEPAACDAIAALAGQCDEALRVRLRGAAASRPGVARHGLWGSGLRMGS